MLGLDSEDQEDGDEDDDGFSFGAQRMTGLHSTPGLHHYPHYRDNDAAAADDDDDDDGNHHHDAGNEGDNSGEDGGRVESNMQLGDGRVECEEPPPPPQQQQQQQLQEADETKRTVLVWSFCSGSAIELTNSACAPTVHLLRSHEIG